MIKKTLAIRCNKCYNIIDETGECYCGRLAFIKFKKVWFIYTDDEGYSIVIVYKDGKNRKIKVVDVDAIKKASVILPINVEVLEKIKPINFKKGRL